MWYVIQVQSRHEHEVAGWIKDLVLKPGEDVFVVQGTRFYRRDGVWERKLSVAFHGYVFAETDDIKSLKARLYQIPAMTKVLKTGETLVPVSEEEQALLLKLGGEEHIIDLSRGYKKNDRLVITEGSMMGLEGLVKWTDRHRRLACIEVMLMGRPTEVRLGVEILDPV